MKVFNMQKIKDKVFDVIIIFGLVFLIMQISIITSDNKDEIKAPVTESVQPTPPVNSSSEPGILPDENKKQVSTDEDQQNYDSIDL